MSATVVFFHVSAFMVSCAVTCGEHAGQCWQKSDWYVWACGKILRSQQGFSHTRSTHLIWSILSSHTWAWMMEKHTIKPEKKTQCFHLNINNQHCTANKQIQFPFRRSSKTEKEHNNITTESLNPGYLLKRNYLYNFNNTLIYGHCLCAAWVWPQTEWTMQATGLVKDKLYLLPKMPH